MHETAEKTGFLGEMKMPRNPNWREETTFEERKNDWASHDGIVDFLCKYQNWRKATRDEDYKGIDVYFSDIPFDIKTTQGNPKTCPFPIVADNNLLFKWYLEHQDLTRFHNTNRIIILYQKQCDPFTAACYIESKMASDKCFKNICYRLEGCGFQKNHPLFHKPFIMRLGLLVRLDT